MTTKQQRLARTAGLLAVIASLSGCQSVQGLHWGWNRTDGGDSQRVSYRPVYESLNGRPLYPGGYAGIDYSASSPTRVRVPAAVQGSTVGPVPTVTVDQGGWGSQ
jgi:hypothetical protein